jgi:hypothetical protein
MTFIIAPPDYIRIKAVTSFHELITTPFGNGINALCWQRTLPGDFTEIARHLPPMYEGCEGTIPLDESWLASLPVSPAGRTAIDILLEDQRQLRAHGLSPILDCIHGYPRDDDAGPVPTDVYSFHVDSATTETDTWLCTYFGAPSEGLPNEQAVRRIGIPATRAELLKAYGGEDDADFLEYLQENCYDLHYAPASNAQPYSFGIGNLWRIAVQHPGSPVPACIHRAPETAAGQPPRLLLIS